MSSEGSEETLVSEIMVTDVHVVGPATSVRETAIIMEKEGHGCVIVVNGNIAIGIVTERDIVQRVTAAGVDASKIRVEDIMTTPLVTIDPDESIAEAARRMSRLDIRRLGVMYKGNLVGIITSKDVLGVMPELLEIIQERAIVEGEAIAENEQEVSPPLAGYCDRCGNWSDDLIEVNGQYHCEDCRVDLEENEE